MPEGREGVSPSQTETQGQTTSEQYRLNKRDMLSRQALSETVGLQGDQLENLRVGVSNIVAEQSLHGLRGLLGRNAKKQYWGISWRELSDVTGLLKEEGDESVTLDNIIGKLNLRYENVYKTYGKGAARRRAINPKSEPPAGDWITVLSGGGVGVGGTQSRKSRGA